MASFRSDGPPFPVRLVVDDAAVESSGWHVVPPAGSSSPGLFGSMIGGALQDPAALPIGSDRLLGTARPGAVRKAARTIPLSAFVSIGRRGFSAPRRVARSANDNLPPPKSGASRPRWRDVLVLVLLFVTLVGAFWSGKLHASYNVIVVPGPSTSRSVVT